MVTGMLCMAYSQGCFKRFDNDDYESPINSKETL